MINWRDSRKILKSNSPDKAINTGNLTFKCLRIFKHRNVSIEKKRMIKGSFLPEKEK
jgi:hypothetical protein